MVMELLLFLLVVSRFYIYFSFNGIAFASGSLSECNHTQRVNFIQS
jgi:hypothetical protein